MLPVPLIILDGLDGVIQLGPITRQLTHAMGSVMEKVDGAKGDLDLLDTVTADAYSIALFFAMPIIALSINYVYHKMVLAFKNVSDLCRGTDNGLTVWNKLVRMLLNQPDYSPDGATMRLVILLCLLATYFVTAVYLAIFGSDMTVIESTKPLDTLAQLNETDRFVNYDQVSLTHAIVFGSADETSRVFQKKTVPVKSFWNMKEFMKTQRALTQQECITFTNLDYHLYYAGGHCMYLLASEGHAPASRYHVSKERFMPTATSYVYGHSTSVELKQRFDSVLIRYTEHGIDAHQSVIRPEIGFETFSGSEHAWQCALKKEMKEESIPTSASLKMLRRTLIISACLTLASLTILILEKFTRFIGALVQTRKRKVVTKQARHTFQGYGMRHSSLMRENLTRCASIRRNSLWPASFTHDLSARNSIRRQSVQVTPSFGTLENRRPSVLERRVFLVPGDKGHALSPGSRWESQHAPRRAIFKVSYQNKRSPREVKL